MNLLLFGNYQLLDLRKRIFSGCLRKISYSNKKRCLDAEEYHENGVQIMADKLTMNLIRQKLKVILYDDHLRINLNLAEKIGAAKGSFYIPYDQVVSAFSREPYNLPGMKIAGTNLPKFLEIGTYLSGSEKQFWYVKSRKHPFLIVVLKSNFYSKIILELKNSDAISKKINDLLGRRMG